MTRIDDDTLEEIAQDEAWLASFDTPPATAEAIARTKKAIRAELAGSEATGRPRWHAWQGAAAGAAAIFLAIGVVWYAAAPPAGRPLINAARGDLVFADEIEQALDAIADDETTSAGFAAAEEDWDLGGAELCDVVEAILTEDQAYDQDQTGAQAPERQRPNQEGRLG